MKTKVHRDGLIFEWISENHKITIGFQKVIHGRCTHCGKRVDEDHTICDECFEKDKKISKK